MSKIDEQIQKLKEHEKKLFTEKRKVEFLHHILASVEGYNEKDFAEVKEEVLQLVKQFVAKSVEAIESGTSVELGVKASQVIETQAPSVALEAPTKVEKPNTPEPFISPAQKMDFAMTHRGMAGKSVQVANDQNLIIRGKVVGLDAPFVLVKVENGPTIKVPPEKVATV